MNRIVFDLTTGEQGIVPLTPEEIADAQVRTAAESLARRPREIEQARDGSIAAGAMYNGNVYQCDAIMVAAIIGRLLRWQLGRIPANATLKVRTKDNKVLLLGQQEHADLADAISAVMEGAYEASWDAKDALN